jgi:ribosomal protein L16 Arg81 hydroxylase
MKELVSSLCETVMREGERFQSALPDTRGRNEAAGGTALSKAAVQAMLAQAQELRWEQKHVRQCFQHPTLTRTWGTHPLQESPQSCAP